MSEETKRQLLTTLNERNKETRHGNNHFGPYSPNPNSHFMKVTVTPNNGSALNAENVRITSNWAIRLCHVSQVVRKRLSLSFLKNVTMTLQWPNFRVSGPIFCWSEQPPDIFYNENRSARNRGMANCVFGLPKNTLPLGCKGLAIGFYCNVDRLVY